jgi:ABC-type spermidine/putrescine transport system permease subunit II/sugar lactone lactonase YvrE
VLTSWPLVVAPVLLLLLLRRAELSWQHLEGPVTPAAFRRQTGRILNRTAGIVTISLTLLSLVLPMFDLLFDRRTWFEFGPALKAGWPAILNSGILAALTAGVVAVAGLLTWHWRIGEWLWLTYLVPGVLTAISLVYLLNHPGFDWLYRGVGVIVLAWTIRYLAPGWNIVARAMRSRDMDLNDAARLEGASTWQEFRAVNWPQIAQQFLAAFYVSYLFCLWDVETLAILQPPGSETLAARVFGFLHYGHNAQVNALCLILMVLAVAPLVVYGGFLNRWPGNGHRTSEFVEATSSRRWLRIIGASFSLALALIIGLVVTGCSRQAADAVAIDSKLFSGVQIIGSRGGGLGQFNKPRSVAVDAQDYLYVVDMTGRVQKFSPEGAFLSYWQMPETDKGKPKGMCRDRAGNIVVLEPHYSRVNHYRPDGSLALQWGAHGTNAGELAFPRAVAVNSRGEIFASEYGLTERVQQFAADGGKLIRSIGHAGGDTGEFNRPEGLGIDAQDRLYVADSCNHRIEVFSPNGEFIRAHGSAGSGRGEMSYPYDVRVDAEGRQYVCEFGNSRIQIFDANDRPIEILGGAGGGAGEFNNPWGLALDSRGNLYVADSMNHRIQKFIRRGGLSADARSVVRGQWSVVSGGQRTTDNGPK